ncbi:hypothetical protein HPP92_016279 [Vanilla planifolia]|uniref:Uncharacterized protein n=1 Tax=Vanilla planifolia TaxID=51239 RepID=A0A835QEY7_VANPL|nr:hypothetical protein HPP92_016903 [Vanilla planifolia]KAG0471733.1 hypothetical protein HPP92_016279 [Vanilla planifolia]
MEALTTTSLPFTRSVSVHVLNRGFGRGSWRKRCSGRSRGEILSLVRLPLVFPRSNPRRSYMLPLFPPSVACSGYGRRECLRKFVAGAASSFPTPGGGDRGEEGGDDGDEVEKALGMDGNIPGSSEEFLRRVSSRAYDMRCHLMQTIDSSSYEVLDRNPWREDSKPVFVLTQGDNQLCTMKTRQNQSEVERELELLFSRRAKWQGKVDNKAKNASSSSKFNMFVEDIRDGVLVFEDEREATSYCELLQDGKLHCEGIAELEVSSVFDICRKMRALAVLFRRGRTPPLPKSLERNLRARKRSLEDQETSSE